MKTLLVLLSGLIAFSSQADLLVYKQRLSLTTTGAGLSYRSSVTGFVILDTDTMEVVNVGASAKMKAVWTQEMQDAYFEQITGPKLKTYTLVVQVRDDADGSDIGTAKGLNVAGIRVGTTNNWSVPKTFTWSGRSVYYNDNDQTIFEESAGTFSLDTTWSGTCNIAHDDVWNAASRLVRYFKTLGYTEIF